MTSKNKRHESPPPLLTEDLSLQQFDESSQGARQTGKIMRQQAENIIRDKVTRLPDLESLSIEQIKHIFHELQVHQIELEMQNEELQRSQGELEATTARYFDLYDLAPVGYCTISESGLILEANMTAANMFGVARKGLIRQPLSRFILKEDQDYYCLFSKNINESSSAQQLNSEQASGLQECDLRMVKSDGVIFWIHLQVTGTQNSGGTPVYKIILIDISALKDAEEQRIKVEDQNRQIQKSESLERMAAAIAHLFNNQLCVVMGNLEMTLNDMTDNTVARQNLVNAMRAARRSSEISGLMLTYLGQNNSKLEPLDLSVTCRHYLAKLQATMPGGIVIETELPFPGPVVYANASQIQQILMHLITNGWEAIGKHAGRVTVSTRSLAASDIPKAHSCHTDWQGSAESYGLLEVTDTGCGMTEKEMGKIFDPFFSTKFTGRGLGLAVVTGLVKAWGGTVIVQSEIGKGSTFQIFLPLVADAIPQGIEMLPEALKFKTGDAVLLIENEAMVRTTTEAMLKHLGFTVFVTADGNEAITLLREHQQVIQCLVIDLSMPGMDGWETLAALRRIQPEIPAILSSGYDELQAMSGDYTEIPQAFLHKPYEIDDLRNVLGKVLGGRDGKET